MEEVSLAEKLEITQKEWETTAAKIRKMLNARAAGPLTEEQISEFFEEWVTVAKRINKGSRMIQQTATSLKFNQDPELMQKMEKLVKLYTFLLNVLGFYDEYFRLTIEKEEHKRLQSTILALLE